MFLTFLVTFELIPFFHETVNNNYSKNMRNFENVFQKKGNGFGGFLKHHTIIIKISFTLLNELFV